jgi:hypothetical protein
MRDKLEPGTVLVARYKGTEHRAEVVAGEEGKTLYRLADGREFKSPSSAASAVMNGQAANGWRFWSLKGDTPTTAASPAPVKAPRTRKPKLATVAADSSETSEATSGGLTAE